jgi:hypothetical protein
VNEIFSALKNKLKSEKNRQKNEKIVEVKKKINKDNCDP